jgi:hypothetical protein
MVQRIKEYTTVTVVPVDISCWISNAVLDIMTTLVIDRDHDGIQSRNELYPALSTLKDTMAFLWGFYRSRDFQALLLGAFRRLLVF